MQVKSFVLCEQIRQEINGKFTLIGVFPTETILNNLPAENRWNNPVVFSILSALQINREIDAGFYIVKVEVSNGITLTPELTLEIKKDGASYFQLPMNIAMSLKGPSDVHLNIYRKDSMEFVTELGHFSITEAGK